MKTLRVKGVLGEKAKTIEVVIKGSIRLEECCCKLKLILKYRNQKSLLYLGRI